MSTPHRDAARPAWRFVFLERPVGSYAMACPPGPPSASFTDHLPRDPWCLEIVVRALEADELAPFQTAYRGPEAPFLGPVRGGWELTIHVDEQELSPWDDPIELLDDNLAHALAATAHAAGGPVIRVADGVARQSIELLEIPAEQLCTRAGYMFGRDVLLRLPTCAHYEAHVRAAMQTLLDEVGWTIGYRYMTHTRHEHVVELAVDPYPEGEAPSLVGWVFDSMFGTRRPTSADRLRGHTLRVFGYPGALAHDLEFWRGPTIEVEH